MCNRNTKSNGLKNYFNWQTGGARSQTYKKALEKKHAREQMLLGELGLTAVKHFVVSRYPVATQNPCVLAFGKISRFKAIAIGK